MPDDVRTVDVRDALAARVEALEARLARLERRQATRLSPADAERLERLLVAVAAACGGSPWTLAELCQLALVDGHAALADVLADVLGAARSLKAGGRFLGRVAGVVVDGLVLEAVTRERSGRVYAVCSQ